MTTPAASRSAGTGGEASGGEALASPSRWKRDPTPMPICACKHSFALHNIERKTRACSACPCARFDLRARERTERRVVVEEVA
jgi:hypothetical protein